MFKGICGRTILTVGLIAVVGTLCAACGGANSAASQDEISQAERHGREEAQEKAKEKRLELKLAKLERENRESKMRRKEKARQQQKLREEAYVSPPAETSSSPAGTDCGDGVIAGPETSCGFALETRAEYEREIGAGSGSIEAWSEANEQWYPMYCTEGSEHECSGAISATVYWP